MIFVLKDFNGNVKRFKIACYVILGLALVVLTLLTLLLLVDAFDEIIRILYGVVFIVLEIILIIFSSIIGIRLLQFLSTKKEVYKVFMRKVILNFLLITNQF